MSEEVKKITDKELEEIQGFVNQINRGQLSIGQLETQKHALLHQMAEVQGSLKECQNKLEKEYGKVNVNITDLSLIHI